MWLRVSQSRPRRTRCLRGPPTHDQGDGRGTPCSLRVPLVFRVGFLELGRPISSPCAPVLRTRPALTFCVVAAIKADVAGKVTVVLFFPFAVPPVRPASVSTPLPPPRSRGPQSGCLALEKAKVFEGPVPPALTRSPRLPNILSL